ncbi:Mitochondrial substrate carrier family protein W [Hondaea fermentalgiana]|uniref:Mitochondrial substrate carrier family protein W n=1 Tax=Hondaea fermentalgiana TaxID=2315210 RepID=A0A2R5GG88_9STRA|nr:Mitochondrial substrate carrier family protein W [Hondaea fermentalgiana]|eukprot:GBG27663.1 Mitochondrial substrate carrier family protein W [Hondaea fermentalgiana]
MGFDGEAQQAQAAQQPHTQPLSLSQQQPQQTRRHGSRAQDVLPRGESERAHELQGAVEFYHRQPEVSRKRGWPFAAVHHTEHLHSALAGAGSGILGALAVAPFDVVKARMQVQGARQQHLVAIAESGSGPAKADARAELNNTPRRYKGTIHAFRQIYKQEGVPGLFRGLPSTIMGYVPSWSIYFSTYGYLKDRVGPVYGPEHPMLCTITSAVVAGAITNLCTNPFWVVRTRLQVQEHVTCEPEYKGTFHAFRKIYRVEGFQAFYKGLSASMLGLSHVGVQFPLYEHLKTVLGSSDFVARHQDSNWSHISVLIAASTLSKFVATTVTYPHDIARARLHVEVQMGSLDPQEPHRGLMRVHVFRVIRNIIAREGFLGLYQGLGTQILRTTPACAITFLSYELLFNYLQNGFIDWDSVDQSDDDN